MSKKFMRRTLLALAAVPVLALSSQAIAADTPLKVGFVYVSPIGEAGWTWP